MRSLFLATLLLCSAPLAAWAASGDAPSFGGRGASPGFNLTSDGALAGLSGRALSEECKTFFPGRKLYLGYKNALKSLIDGKMPSFGTTVLDCFLPPGQTSEGDSPKNIYSRIVRTSFEPGVMYYAIAQEMEEVLAQDARADNHQRLAWRGAYIAEAAIVAYKRTRQERFLRIFVKYQDQVLARRDDKEGRRDPFHGRIMKAWAAWTETEVDEVTNSTGVAHVTPNSRIVYPGLAFAQIVQQSGPLRAKYGGAAARYVTAAEETMAEFEEDWAAGQAVPWFVSPHRERRQEPINHVHQAGNVYLTLASLTNKKKYAERVQAIVDVFERSVKKGPGGTVYWNYFPYFATKEKKQYGLGRMYSEPVFKASLTTPFILRAQLEGYDVSGYLLPAIVRTFMDLCFEEDKMLYNLSPVKSHYVDPKTDSKRRLGVAQNVVILAEFDRIAPQVAARMATLVAARPDIWPLGWIDGSHGLLGMAYYV